MPGTVAQLVAPAVGLAQHGCPRARVDHADPPVAQAQGDPAVAPRAGAAALDLRLLQLRLNGAAAKHNTEDNTIVNTVTGLTLRDSPVNFVQTTFFDVETGRRDRVLIAGTSVHVVRGQEKLIDRGTLMIDGQTGKILWSIGNVPVRRQMDGSFNTRDTLPAFCHILR